MAPKRSGLITKALNYLKKPPRRKGSAAHNLSARELTHLMRGELRTWNGDLVGTGYHYRPGGEDLPGRRIGDVQATHPNGVYDAKTEYRNPHPPPEWVPKKSWSSKDATNTFFPDKWSPQDIDTAMSESFKHGRKDPDGKWYGEHNGVYIKGYWDPSTGRIGNGHPVSPNEYEDMRKKLGK
ncbi:hypothetical protein GCM10009830_20830 [Glycomyces endophyticus]|uniref:Bacterial EndoU nuclease domain-containing protein n=1 Tax=Glycomyces endophyticus TaxID=480996 RepID=A0ABN2GQ31_9ACTN